jgi:hypothetical protein
MPSRRSAGDWVAVREDHVPRTPPRSLVLARAVTGAAKSATVSLMRSSSQSERFLSELAALRAQLAAPRQDETIRELYGRLLAKHRKVPARIAALRTLGAEISTLEASGVLPRTLSVRANRR